MRYIFIATAYGTMLALLLVPIHNLVRPVVPVPDNRRIGLALLVYSLGPGLVANGIFKSFWGRARPHDILEFGGHRLFSSTLLPSHQWQASCSFVSGEASAVTAVAPMRSRPLVVWRNVMEREGAKG